MTTTFRTRIFHSFHLLYNTFGKCVAKDKALHNKVLPDESDTDYSYIVSSSRTSQTTIFFSFKSKVNVSDDRGSALQDSCGLDTARNSPLIVSLLIPNFKKPCLSDTYCWSTTLLPSSSETSSGTTRPFSFIACKCQYPLLPTTRYGYLSSMVNR